MEASEIKEKKPIDTTPNAQPNNLRFQKELIETKKGEYVNLEIECLKESLTFSIVESTNFIARNYMSEYKLPMIDEQTKNITFHTIEQAFYYLKKKIDRVDKGEHCCLIDKPKENLYTIEINAEGDLGEIKLRFELPMDESVKEDIQEKINELGKMVEKLKLMLDPSEKENKPIKYAVIMNESREIGIGIVDNKIKIRIIDKEKLIPVIYESESGEEEIKKKYEIFKKSDGVNEIYENIKMIMEEKNYEIKREEDSYVIRLKCNYIRKEEEIEMRIRKQSMNIYKELNKIIEIIKLVLK